MTIPNSVTGIGTGAFYGCSGLASVTIPNSVTTIGDAAFRDCSGLASVTIGTGVLSIGSEAFYNAKPKKVIWLTNTPPSGYSNAAGVVNYVANDQYTSLSNTTVYPFLSSVFEVDGIKYVPVSPSDRTCDAIDCCYDETAANINIGSTVSYRGVSMTVKQVLPYLCYGNKNVVNVQLSFDGSLGEYAFSGCTALQEATIDNKGVIGSYAFSGSGVKTLTIGTNVTGISGGAFQSCASLKTAVLGDSIAYIGSDAFYGCRSLKSIDIPDATTTLGSYAFQNCTSLNTARIGSGLAKIDNYTFSGCSALTDVQIGAKVETIGERAFTGCSALPSIRIPQAVTAISGYAFNGCSALKTVVMDDKADDSGLTLGSNGQSPLFASCPLDSVYIGRNIQYKTSSSYGYSPFYRNTSLRTVVITDRETEISANEFYGCTSLKDVRIGDGVTTIGNWAFSGCSSLDAFAFGTGVTSIGQEAFSDCTAMTRLVSRAATPPACGTQALDDINKWNCTLTVPAGCIPAYQQAEQWKEFFFISDEDTGVSNVRQAGTAGEKARYTLGGRRTAQPQTGLNIIKMTDGTTRKVVER